MLCCGVWQAECSERPESECVTRGTSSDECQ